MSEFEDVESREGIRMPFNVVSSAPDLPDSIPLSALFTPLKPLSVLPLLPFSPLRCRLCRSVLNPFASLDPTSNLWTCPLCHHPNHLPSSASHHLPPPLPTVEYLPPPLHRSPPAPVFLFVIDTAVDANELQLLKSAVSRAVDRIADGGGLVGLIAFGKNVQVYELGFGVITKCYVFRGDKGVSRDELLEKLGFFVGKVRPKGGVIAGALDGLCAESIARFLLPASLCEFIFNSVLEELEKDPWPVSIDHRAARCTGMALSVAVSLLGFCVPGTGARIMAFVGGPATEGLGTIVSKNLSEAIRSHKDLDKDSVPYYQTAINFYEGLSKQLVNQGHVLDLFACALDQVGLAELRVAVERSGGFVVLAESFGHSVFKDSLERIFQSSDNNCEFAFNGIFEINCSKDVQIQGIIGPCASLEKKGSLCSEMVVGQGNTTAWKMCGLDEATTLCLVFDITRKDSRGATGQPMNNQIYFQFLTYYQHNSGQMRLRVTTLSRRWVTGPGCIQDLIAGFDQEAATVVLARMVSFKMENETEFDPIRWLDRSLIRLCSRFGDYQKNNPSSFSYSPYFSMFPQLMFHLRRSQFVQVFNNSPDETAYYRMILNREHVSNSIKMIQPSLISYSFHSAPEPVLLDVVSIAADKILVLDSYFTVVVFNGFTIAQWRKNGYQLHPEQEAFAQLLQAPQDYAESIIKDRFPVPRLVICDQYGSQARFLLAKLNPSSTFNSRSPSLPGGDVIFTDDVSFDVFLDHLQRLAVR